MTRNLKFSEAILEATDLCLAADPSVYVIGLGAPDPTGVFGTTKGLVDKFGPKRIFDMPTSESAITGVALGSAVSGSRPIMTHQRVDFALTAAEQIINQVAKWCYMFGGQKSVPLVIRMIVGRGWGQGPQHSQSLQAIFAHIPGLKVVMPTTPADAKGLLISAVEDNNPVIFLENRWLHNISGPVPEGMYRVPLGEGRVMHEGGDVTIAAISHMALEAHRAAEKLALEGILAEVIDVRTLRPLDNSLILKSVKKTGRLIVADPGWKVGGFSGEIVADTMENAFSSLKCAPRRIALPDCPTPTSRALADAYYPRSFDIANAVREMLGRETIREAAEDRPKYLDIPDPSFTGPF